MLRLAAALTLLLTSLSARAQSVTISLGTVTIPAGTATFAVPVNVTGSAQFSDMVAMFQIGDGGPLFGGVSGPRITAIDLTGGIWGSDPARYDVFAGAAFPAQVQQLSVSLKTAGDRVTASGRLCTLQLDTAGFSGSYDLKMKSTVAGQDSRFTAAGVNVTTAITNGTLSFGGPSSPPPAVTLSRLTGGAMRLSFAGESGRTYRVEWTANIAGTWTNISATLTGSGTTLTWTDDGSQTGSPPSSALRRFYRVRRL